MADDISVEESGYRSPVKPIDLRELVLDTTFSWSGYTRAVPDEQFVNEPGFLEGTIDEVLDKIPARNLEDVLRQALRLFVVQVCNKEYQREQAVEAEREKHRLGDFATSSFPQGAFPDVTEDQG